MGTFGLHAAEVVQGDFSIAEANLLLVFQVNCPGCFLYALPLAAQLHRELEPLGVKVLGLSTAFEDFGLNTVENTRALLTDGILIGETARVLAQEGIQRLPVAIDFPVAFDQLVAPESYTPTEISRIVEGHPAWANLLEQERPLFIEQVSAHYRSQKYLPRTFTDNHLPGTPTWIAFDGNFNELHRAFGHRFTLEHARQIFASNRA